MIMKRLDQLYKELMGVPEKWRYYDGLQANFEELFIRNNCEEFILHTLMKGHKDKIGLFTDSIESLSIMRKQHIVSCYFLGLLIYHSNQLIRDLVDNQVKKLNSNKWEESLDKKFYYIWMLICLFHDLGYAIEEYNNNYESIKEVLKTNKNFTKPRYVPKIYNKTLLQRYWDYRWCRWNVKDHGIIGGLRFFKEICDLREQMDDGNDTEHHWNEELVNDYACAAWIIACHNIFTIKEGSEYEYCYKHFHLDNLITSEHVIKIENHPILFLFCLVDSIEPIKTFGDCSYFDKITMHINPYDQIELDLDKLPNGIKRKMIKIGLDLNDWLTFSENKENCLIINLKPQLL